MPLKLSEMFAVITLPMVIRGAAYPFHSAYNVVMSKKLTPRGLSFWKEVRLTAQQLATAPVPPHVPPASEFKLLGDLQQLERAEDGSIKLHAKHGTIHITLLDSGTFRARTIWNIDPPNPRHSYAVAKADTEWAAVQAEISETATEVRIKTPLLTIVAHKQPCRIEVLDAQGKSLFAETAGSGRHELGHRLWRAAFHPKTAFYGLGEKTTSLNHAGQAFEMWNFDPAGYGRGKDPIYMNIPFFTALHDGQAVGVFIDNTHRAWIDQGSEQAGHVEWIATGGDQVMYIMVGTPQDVIRQYTEITGRTKLPPLWAFGFHQSRWSYFQSDVLSLVDEFRQRQIPCDVIHLDIHYMDGYRCFTWGKEHYPDPHGMIKHMRQQGYKTIAIIDPGIKIDRNYWVYQQGVQGDMFIKYPHGARFVGPVWPGDCHFPDFTSPRVRDWWGTLYKGLLEDGIDAFWNDMNEPALITRVTGLTIPEVVEHDWEGQGATHAEAHNIFGMQMVRASTEGITKLRPDKRSMIITRSGYAGVQRHAIHWTGDNGSSWDHLKLSLQMVLTLGFSGIPITGPDIGGFSGGPSPELFARWISVGALFPFCRVHSMIGSPQQEPWQFGPEVETITREYLGLRYRLLPYLYTAAWQASQTGAPIIRALSFTYPSDSRTYSIDDQFMLGDSILVAPVVEEGLTSREVYLPSGVWFDFWTHESHQGGQSITASAPLDRVPMYIRAGAAIPFWPLQQYVGQKPIDVLDLQVFWTDDVYESVLYEDDGDRPDYALPEVHRATRITVDGKQNTIRLLSEGGYKPSYQRIRIHLIGQKPPLSQFSVEGGTIVNTTQIEAAQEQIVEIEVTGDLTIKL